MSDHALKSLRHKWLWLFGPVKATCNCGATFWGRDERWALDKHQDHGWEINYARRTANRRQK